MHPVARQLLAAFASCLGERRGTSANRPLGVGIAAHVAEHEPPHALLMAPHELIERGAVAGVELLDEDPIWIGAHREVRQRQASDEHVHERSDPRLASVVKHAVGCSANLAKR